MKCKLCGNQSHSAYDIWHKVDCPARINPNALADIYEEFGGDAVDRSEFWESVAPNGDELKQKIYAIEKAVNKYYLALDLGQHGGIAERKAFDEIQAVLDMRWERGKMTSFLEKHPEMKPLYE